LKFSGRIKIVEKGNQLGLAKFMFSEEIQAAIGLGALQ